MNAEEPSVTDATEADVPVTFESGDRRLNALLSRPDLAAGVAAQRERMRQADREHAIGLAMVRQAARLTQAELAESLGVGQAAVAKIEHRQDMLLSTLRSYLAAAGARARLVVEFGNEGHEVELDLDSLGRPPAQRSGRDGD